MFSDILRNYVITDILTATPDGIMPLRVIESPTSTMLQRVSIVPTKRNLIAWARELSVFEWQRCGDFAHVRHPGCREPRLQVEGVRVRYVVTEFNGKSGLYAVMQIDEYEYKRSGRNQVL